MSKWKVKCSNRLHQFHIIDVLGVGGDGIVFRALARRSDSINISEGKTYALKVVCYRCCNSIEEATKKREKKLVAIGGTGAHTVKLSRIEGVKRGVSGLDFPWKQPGKKEVASLASCLDKCGTVYYVSDYSVEGNVREFRMYQHVTYLYQNTNEARYAVSAMDHFYEQVDGREDLLLGCLIMTEAKCTLNNYKIEHMPSFQFAIQICLTLAKGLAFLHRHDISHNDIHKDNIYVLRKGGLPDEKEREKMSNYDSRQPEECDFVQLGDFGVPVKQFLVKGDNFKRGDIRRLLYEVFYPLLLKKRFPERWGSYNISTFRNLKLQDLFIEKLYGKREKLLIGVVAQQFEFLCSRFEEEEDFSAEDMVEKFKEFKFISDLNKNSEDDLLNFHVHGKKEMEIYAYINGGKKDVGKTK